LTYVAVSMNHGYNQSPNLMTQNVTGPKVFEIDRHLSLMGD